MRIASVLTAFAMLVLPVAIADAHALQQSLEKQVGEYLVDIGYDALALQPGKDIVFNFGIILNADKPNWEFARFTEARVTFAKKGETAEPKVIQVDPPLLAYMVQNFPSRGAYELAVQFYDGEKLVTEASFPLQVGPPAVAGLWYTYAGILTLIVALFAIVLSRRLPEGHTASA